MSPAAIGQRALSTLAKKLHPQLPLTPRESQQLLNLLTTSFRAHLDREHPPHTSETASRRTSNREPYDHHASLRATSSAALASKHLNTVLSNPLFAVKPSRHCPQSAASQALNDPLGWFLNEIAIGTASLSKVSTCLDMLDRPGQMPQLHHGRTPGAVIGGWLNSSGMDKQINFYQMCIAPNNFISRLVTMLMADGEKRLLWKWFARPRANDGKAFTFKKLVLKHMVRVGVSENLSEGLLLFERAHDICGEQQGGYDRLRPAGQYLIQTIMSTPTNLISHELYDSFKRSTKLWIPATWAQAVDPMLWLHHPTGASTTPGLQFIHDPTGAAAYATARPSLRSFVVQLSLGVARQLLEEERYDDAQAVMAVTKQHFPDLVLSDLSTEKSAPTSRLHKAERRHAREERILELLDGLAPT